MKKKKNRDTDVHAKHTHTNVRVDIQTYVHSGICTYLYIYINTCSHMLTRTSFFSGFDNPYTCVWVFPQQCSPHNHLPITRGEAEVHRTGWVWKRGRERREAGPVPTGLTHGCTLTTKTPAAWGHGTPVGGADTCTHTHECKCGQTWTYMDTHTNIYAAHRDTHTKVSAGLTKQHLCYLEFNLTLI